MARSTARRPARAVREIETGLRMLSSGLRRLAQDVRVARDGAAERPGRRRPITRALRLQGRYMGLIRTLPARKKQQVMTVRASKGVEEAIRMARGMKA